jgi:hypothetical protein
MLQNALTVITKIKPGETPALKAFLTVIGRDIKGKRDNVHVSFADIHTTHFARWVIINEQGEPHLLFTSNHDGTWEEYVDLLIAKIGPALDEIWGRCEGYPSGRMQNPQQFSIDFKKYLWKHSYEVDTFYLGYRHVQVKELKGYLKLREKIEEVLDLKAVRAALAEIIPAMPLDPAVAQAASAFWVNAKNAAIIAWVVIETVFYFLFLVFIRPLQVWLRGTPRINYKTPPPSAADTYPAEIEDFISQNQMTVITRIKPLRLLILKLVLAFIHTAAKYIFNQGSLASLATIHFARWIIIDNGTHLLFESNYDSTWESYIGDFIDRVSNGMNAVWRHSVGFPHTTGLIDTQHGCKDVEAFKTYIRQNQIEAQTFYSAYPKHTIRNLLSAIRIGKSLNQQDVVQWLRRF